MFLWACLVPALEWPWPRTRVTLHLEKLTANITKYIFAFVVLTQCYYVVENWLCADVPSEGYFFWTWGTTGICQQKLSLFCSGMLVMPSWIIGIQAKLGAMRVYGTIEGSDYHLSRTADTLGWSGAVVLPTNTLLRSTVKWDACVAGKWIVWISWETFG